MIARQPAGVKPEMDHVHPLPSDPRIALFARLVYAAEMGDSRAGIEATRELRRLGYSVCLLAPRGEAVRP